MNISVTHSTTSRQLSFWKAEWLLKPFIREVICILQSLLWDAPIDDFCKAEQIHLNAVCNHSLAVLHLWIDNNIPPLSPLPPPFSHSQGCNWIWFVAALGPVSCLWEWERSTQAAPWTEASTSLAEVTHTGFMAHTQYVHASVSESWLCLHDRKQTKKWELQVWVAVMPPISVYNSNLGRWCLARTTQLQYSMMTSDYKQIRHQ